MYWMNTQARRLLNNADGPTTCEYAILLALIIIVAIVGIELLGPGMRTVFTLVTGAIP